MLSNYHIPREDMELLQEYISGEDCWFDHHGYCQAHGLTSGVDGLCGIGRMANIEPGMPYIQSELLLLGLAYGNEDLYETSATFKTQVDTLAQMLQSWVKVLAEDAESLDEKLKLAQELLEGIDLKWTP